MKIAIIGTGNVGGALATKWSEAGHKLFLGVKNTSSVMSSINSRIFIILKKN